MEPKILFFDIETTPVKAWIWRTGQQYVNHKMICEGEQFDIICICWKWLGQREVHALDWGLRKQDSSKMISKFAKEVEKADIVIGQNSDHFDIKQVNTQRLLHRQPPIAWPTAEDTRKMVRSKFYVTSSSLAYLGRMLKQGSKDRMEFEDWVDIIDRYDAKALKKMIKYCKQDVRLTESVWKEIAPYCKPKANRSLMLNGHRNGCPRCGSENRKKWGRVPLNSGIYQRFACGDCGYKWRHHKKLDLD